MRYKVTVAYDGSKFIGWQNNPAGLSVQEKITKALKIIYKEDLFIVGSGRTDKGVSALGQVFHFDAPFLIDSKRLIYALNNLVHPYIHIVNIEVVDASFHSRYHALYKSYRYSIELGPYNVLEADHITQLNKPLDLESMKACAQLFLGTHDFTSFNTSTLEEVNDQVRTIYQIDLVMEGSILQIDITGNGFLRYMIRMLVGTMLEVGLGRLSLKQVATMLASQRKGTCRYKAAANGLKLVHVEYHKSFETD